MCWLRAQEFTHYNLLYYTVHACVYACAGKVHMMPPPVNFEPTRVPTVELDADQFDAARVTFADQMAAPPTRPVQQNYAPPPPQKIYAPPMRTQTPIEQRTVQVAQPPAPPPRELPPAAPLQLNIPDKVRARCKSICNLEYIEVYLS